jgi:acid phosphatase type 7
MTYVRGNFLVLCCLTLFISLNLNANAQTLDATLLPKLKSFTHTQATTTAKIAAVGDIACDPTSSYYNAQNPLFCQHVAVSNLIKQQGVGNILILGDNQYENGSLANYTTSFSRFESGMGSYLLPTAGNHEYSTTGASGYFSYFGQRAGTVGQGWYSKDIGKWHVISLNSNCNQVGCTIGSSQYQWLENDLNQTNSACTLVFWHHPRYSSGSSHGNNSWHNDMYNLMLSKKVDVLLQGHEHNYERFAKMDGNGQISNTGVRTFVVGTGGKNLYPFGTIKHGSEVRYNNNHGALFMNLSPTSYSWEYKSISGSIRDSGTDACII